MNILNLYTGRLNQSQYFFLNTTGQLVLSTIIKNHENINKYGDEPNNHDDH